MKLFRLNNGRIETKEVSANRAARMKRAGWLVDAPETFAPKKPRKKKAQANADKA